MNATRADDPHPDDEEAQRLLAEYGRAVATLGALQLLAPTDDGYQQAERIRDERVARGEMERIDRRLAGLHLPVEGHDFTEPTAKPTRTPPEIPLVPGRPCWGTSFRDANEELVAAAVEDAHRAFDANKRAEPPRITALQVLDHYLARGEPLPPRALKLLGRALRINPRSVEAWHRWTLIRAADSAGRTTQDIVAELGISEEAVRALRKPRKKTAALVLFAAVETATAAGEPPLRSTRDAIARQLKIVDGNGRLRRKVIETLHGGIRQPGKVREAAKAEARRRLGRRPNGKEHPRNDANALARLVGQDARDVAEWTRREWWETLVYCEEYWLREERRAERRRTLQRNNTPPESKSLIDYDRAEGVVRVMARAESQAMRTAMRKARAGNQRAE